MYVGSDKLYGKYYYYDAVKDEVKLLMDLMPNLKEEDMAEIVLSALLPGMAPALWLYYHS